jgi:hypothetical protein
MKRIFFLVLGFTLLLPLSVEAQFGPIIPEVCRACPCGFGGVLAIIQNVVNFLIGISIIFATIIIVWAGGLYILSATNPESRSTANKMLINAAVGLLIVLSAWLIVDFVMKTLYDSGSEFGPWNSILAGNGEEDSCIVANTTDTPSLFSGNLFTVPGQPAGGSGSGANCPAAEESTMVAFPPSVVVSGSGKATPATVENFMAMRAAALEDGIDLKISSAYRSEATQVDLWNQYQQGTIQGSVGKPCSIPGGRGSNHNSGVAIDIRVGCLNGNTNCDTPTYRWLKANGHRWNFRNAIQNDPPHWSPTGH